MQLMIRHSWTFSLDHERLDNFLRRELPSLLDSGLEASNSKIRRLIIAGAVQVDGRECRRPSWDLRKGETVSVQLDEQKFFFEKKPDDIDFTLTAKDVLFEDESIIVVNKPAFLPTEETFVKGRGNMHQAVVDYLWKKNPSLRNPPYAGIMHRLDRETSGTLLFTKTRAVNKAVHDMFEQHTVHKIYRAVCSTSGGKTPEASFSVEDYIGRVSGKSEACKMGLVPQNKGGLYARTDFVLKESKMSGRIKLCYFECALHTGRTHQIRVHLSLSGFPIVGDELYGGIAGGADCGGRIMLHAMQLEFPHPVTGKTINVKAPLPQGFCK